MKKNLTAITTAALMALLIGCNKPAEQKPAEPSTNKTPEKAAAPQGHAHAEDDLGKAKVGDIEVTFAQGHGKVEAGKFCHLVVKLPYNDKGATAVRTWIGTEDRTLSEVGKGEYAPGHDDYDVHATAPDPLPENVMWWVELEKPDGTKATGSIKPLL